MGKVYLNCYMGFVTVILLTDDPSNSVEWHAKHLDERQVL